MCILFEDISGSHHMTQLFSLSLAGFRECRAKGCSSGLIGSLMTRLSLMLPPLFGSSLEFETDTGTFPTDREEFPQEDSRITGSMPERYSKLMVEKYRGRA